MRRLFKSTLDLRSLKVAGRFEVALVALQVAYRLEAWRVVQIVFEFTCLDQAHRV